MDEPFLIAHVVRGEPAFDIAIKQDCPICIGKFHDDIPKGCDECDGEGYWWICSTSGHRARPFWNIPLEVRQLEGGGMRLIMDHNEKVLAWTIFDPPPGWPDHFPCNPSPKEPGMLDKIISALKPKPPTIKRRV